MNRKLFTLVSLLLFSLFQSVNAQEQYIAPLDFKNMAYDVIITAKTDSSGYEITLNGPEIRIGDASANEALRVKQYDTLSRITFRPASEGDVVKYNLPFDFTFGEYNTRIISLFAGKISKDNISGALLDKIKNDAILNTGIERSYGTIKEKLINKRTKIIAEDIAKTQNAAVAEKNKEMSMTIDSLLNAIENTDEDNQYGGHFTLAETQRGWIRVSKASHDSIFDTSRVRLYLDTVIVKTFNNMIDRLLVVGRLSVDDVMYPVEFYNIQYSYPLKHLFKRNQNPVFRVPVNITSALNKKKFNRTYYEYSVNLSDIIRITPYRNNFTFMVKDGSYRLTQENKAVRFKRKEFYDYLSVVTFLDFMGVMDRTPNGLLQMEGKLRLPLQLNNSQVKTFNHVFFPKLDVDMNATFINGSQQDKRYAAIFSESQDPSNIDTLYIDNFDLLRKYNIMTGLNLGVYKYEAKNTNVNFFLEYQAHFLRTSLRYMQLMRDTNDVEQRFNGWSYNHGPSIRAEYRPDQNLGADLSIAVNLDQKLLNSENDNLLVKSAIGPFNKNVRQASIKETNRAQRVNYKMEFNAYFMINPSQSNGGLYFRLCNYFSHDFKQIFPQVLVGYSTRLNGMINNIKSSTAR